MTTDDYLLCLEALNVTPHSKAAVALLGLSRRQLAKIAAGEVKPSATLERLLYALMKLKRK